jgi:hypothetical protein
MPFKPGQGAPIVLPATHDKPLNARQERFALGLTQGMSKWAAFRAAGYGRSSTGPQRLLAMPNVIARVEELRAQARAQHKVTVTEITRSLRAIVARNADSDSITAQELARRALMDLAKLHGLLTERHEVALVNPVTEIRRVIVYPDGRATDYCGNPVD